MMDDEATLAEVDEAIEHLRETLAISINAKDSRAIAKYRALIDGLLEARMILTRDLPAVMACAPVFSG